MPAPDVLSGILDALGNHQRVVLSTIISSSGSTPLPTGSSMILKEDHSSMGTVGGGSLEGSAIEQAKQLFPGGGSLIQSFELSETETVDGMICGGSVELLFEVLGDEDRVLFSQLRDSRAGGTDCALVRIIDSDRRSVQRTLIEGTSIEAVNKNPPASLLAEKNIALEKFHQHLQQAHRAEEVTRLPGSQGELIIQPIVGIQPLIIFGGGHVARSLSKVAAMAGFAVTIIDDREEFANSQRFPEAAQTLSMKFDEAFQHVVVTSSTSIVIVTRGHRLDAAVLGQAIRYPARYIGMIGSTKKVIASFDQLLAQGVSLPQLGRVSAPIGLDIAAVTAEEIAVSIVAELIQVRRGRPAASASMSGRVREWLEQMARGEGKPQPGR